MFARFRNAHRPAVTPRTRGVAVAAWSVPVMVATQFAFLSGIPVVYVLVCAFRNPRLRALRWWAVALGVLYATPLASWLVGPDRPSSLSKDIHPALAVALALGGAVVAVRYHLLQRRALASSERTRAKDEEARVV